jgi:hypothetical protein
MSKTGVSVLIFIFTIFLSPLLAFGQEISTADQAPLIDLKMADYVAVNVVVEGFEKIILSPESDEYLYLKDKNLCHRQIEARLDELRQPPFLKTLFPSKLLSENPDAKFSAQILLRFEWRYVGPALDEGAVEIDLDDLKLSKLHFLSLPSRDEEPVANIKVEIFELNNQQDQNGCDVDQTFKDLFNLKRLGHVKPEEAAPEDPGQVI